MFTLAQSRTAPKELIDFAKNEIQDVLMNVRSVNYVMLCSTDGFELAHVYKRDGYNSTKLAAVSSSILAMVAAFMNEIHLEGCQSITLDADNGKAILTSIPLYCQRHSKIDPFYLTNGKVKLTPLISY